MSDMTQSYVWCDWFIRVTWLSHMCIKTHVYLSQDSLIHSNVWHDSVICWREGWSTWMSHVTHMNESCHAYEWVMSLIWMSHGTMNESWRTYKQDMIHTWTSHGTHVNESRHTGRSEGGGARHDRTRTQPQIYESKTSQIQRYPCLSYRALYLHKRALHLGKRALYPHTRGLYATHDSHPTTDIRVQDLPHTTLSSQRYPFFPYRALHVCKRTLYLRTRALYVSKRALYLRKRALFFTKEPSISAKETCISAK